MKPSATETGPAPLFGILYRDWRRIRAEVGPLSGKRVAHIGLRGLLNEALHFEEERQFGRRIDEQIVAPPLIVLGLARSGTTFLHQLLASDPRFAYPRASEAFNPHTFLTREGVARGLLARFLRGLNLVYSRLVFGRPTVRSRGFDQVQITAATPEEDEHALLMSGLSPMLATLFPRQAERFLRTDEAWRRACQRCWLRFLKKLSLRYGGKPLVLKSPFHMARISSILEILPGARFVFVCRQPEAIYRSLRRAAELVAESWSFQELPGDPDDRSIRLNRGLIEQYLSEAAGIPAGQSATIRYEDLVADPVKSLEELYRKLSLGEFTDSHLAERRGYQVGDHAPLEPEISDRLKREWGAYYQAFGYR